MTKEEKQEYTLKISRANKTQLVVILYEIMLQYMDEAQEAYGAGDRVAYRQALKKARNCIGELTASLHFEHELAHQIFELYIYTNRELIAADAKYSTEYVEHARIVIRGLWEAYQQVSLTDSSAPVMSNVQSITAGLTYGKGNLVESLGDQGLGRGYYI